MKLTSHLAVAARYWEPKRLIYNGVLAVLALACWGPEILAGGAEHWLGGGLVLAALALIANALYCAAYPVDVALQISPVKAVWERSRWVLFSVGTVLASTLALWVLLHDGMA